MNDLDSDKTKTSILVIDDDPDLCELVSDALSDHYSISICNNGEAALDFCSSIRPAIVVLDIHFRNANGFNICSAIHENISPAPMVLFISGENTVEQRLEAYNYGGDDFLAKPFQISELRAKIDSLKVFHDRQTELKNTSDYAAKTAMHAMTEASQYGGVLRFYNDMYRASSVEKIVELFFKLMGEFELKSSIQIRIDETCTLDFGGDECSPIEMQIYENLCDNGRLIAFSNRLMVNGMFVSFIVKNMPINNEVSNGRLKDILATLIEGLDSKIMDLQRLTLLRQTAREVASSSQRLSKVMKDHEGFIVGAMNHVISEINGSFDILNLNEEQEQFFTKLAETIINSVEDSFTSIGKEQDVLNCLWLSLSNVLGQNIRVS